MVFTIASPRATERGSACLAALPLASVKWSAIGFDTHHIRGLGLGFDFYLLGCFFIHASRISESGAVVNRFVKLFYPARGKESGAVKAGIASGKDCRVVLGHCLALIEVLNLADYLSNHLEVFACHHGEDISRSRGFCPELSESFHGFLLPRSA